MAKLKNEKAIHFKKTYAYTLTENVYGTKTISDSLEADDAFDAYSKVLEVLNKINALIPNKDDQFTISNIELQER